MKSVYLTTEYTEITEGSRRSMDNIYLKFFKKMTLLEIVTIRDFPESRKKADNKITGVYLKQAYKDKLEQKLAFINFLEAEHIISPLH